jgi:hypothetical protein
VLRLFQEDRWCHDSLYPHEQDSSKEVCTVDFISIYTYFKKFLVRLKPIVFQTNKQVNRNRTMDSVGGTAIRVRGGDKNRSKIDQSPNKD